VGSEWWEAFWFFLPAGIANMAPVFASKIPGLRDWQTPLDFAKSYKGKRIFGNNKTWRGLIFGVIAAIITSLLQYRFIANSTESTLFIITVAAAMGAGALLGDALESLLKRQLGIAAGESWLPFDQTDFIIGGLLLVYPLIHVPLRQVIVIFVIYFGLHLLASYIGYLLGLKKKPI